MQAAYALWRSNLLAAVAIALVQTECRRRLIYLQVAYGIPTQFGATRELCEEFISAKKNQRNTARLGFINFSSDDVSREPGRNFWVRFNEPIRLRSRWLSRALSIDKPSRLQTEFTSADFSPPPYVLYLCILRRTVRRLVLWLFIRLTKHRPPSPVESQLSSCSWSRGPTGDRHRLQLLRY